MTADKLTVEEISNPNFRKMLMHGGVSVKKLEALCDLALRALRRGQPADGETPEVAQLRHDLARHIIIASQEVSARVELERELASARSSTAAPERETVRVYRGGETYKSYQTARFAYHKTGVESFEWRGRRYRYLHSDFDDSGDFDTLLTGAPTDSTTKTICENCGGVGYIPCNDYVDGYAIPSGEPCPDCNRRNDGDKRP